MIKIPELTNADIDALVDYVIYLSWRGELERRIIDDAIFELDLEGGDRILNTELATRLAAESELANQLDELRRLAHQMKGASGGYGFEPLGDIAGQIEQAIDNESNLENIQSSVEELIALCRRVSI